MCVEVVTHSWYKLVMKIDEIIKIDIWSLLKLKLN